MDIDIHFRLDGEWVEAMERPQLVADKNYNSVQSFPFSIYPKSGATMFLKCLVGVTNKSGRWVGR